MIITITLNPAVDRTCQISELRVGQVNRLTQVKDAPGGKGINVARILHQFGMDVLAMGFLGGKNGEFIADSLNEQHIPNDFVFIQGETRTSMNIIGADGFVTEILEPGPIVTGLQVAKLLDKLEEHLPECDLVILSGSIASGVPIDIYNKIQAVCKRYQKRVCLDTSGEPLKEGVKEIPFMIKPNRKELEYLMGCGLKDNDRLVEAVDILRSKGIEHVMVSLGEKGLLYASGEECLFAAPPELEIGNTVGCGDTVVACFALSYLKNENAKDTMKRALATSAANAAAVNKDQIDLELADKLMKMVKIQRQNA